MENFFSAVSISSLLKPVAAVISPLVKR